MELPSSTFLSSFITYIDQNCSSGLGCETSTEAVNRNKSSTNFSLQVNLIISMTKLERCETLIFQLWEIGKRNYEVEIGIIQWADNWVTSKSITSNWGDSDKRIGLKDFVVSTNWETDFQKAWMKFKSVPTARGYQKKLHSQVLLGLKREHQLINTQQDLLEFTTACISHHLPWDRRKL